MNRGPDEATLDHLLSALSSGNGAAFNAIAALAWTEPTPAKSAFFRVLLHEPHGRDRAFFYFGHAQDPEVLPFGRDALRGASSPDRHAAKLQEGLPKGGILSSGSNSPRVRRCEKPPLRSRA